MAEVYLSLGDVRTLRRILRGRPRPEGVREGTWFHLASPSSDLVDECLPISEFVALGRAEPQILRVLGFLRKSGDRRQTG